MRDTLRKDPCRFRITPKSEAVRLSEEINQTCFKRAQNIAASDNPHESLAFIHDQQRLLWCYRGIMTRNPVGVVNE